MHFLSSLLFAGTLVVCCLFSQLPVEVSASTPSVVKVNLVSSGIDTSKDSIRQIVHKIAVDLEEHYNLSKHFPDLVELVKAKIVKLRACYDSRINGKKVNIFTTPIGVVIKAFFEKYHTLVQTMPKEEVEKRIKIFLNNVLNIVRSVIKCVRNKDPKHIPTKLGLTPLLYYSEEEFRAKFTPGIKHQKKPAPLRQSPAIRSRIGDDDVETTTGYFFPQMCQLEKNTNTTLPEEFDWRDKGVITPVMSQGCGDCYLHAGVSAFESHYALRVPGAKLTQFSRQDLLNCYYGGNSCEGGDCTSVWDLILRRGIELEVDEPYGGKNVTCREEGPKKTFPIADLPTLQYCDAILVNNNDELKTLLLRYGPLKASIYTPPIPAGLVGPMNDQCVLPDNAYQNHQVFITGWDKTYWHIKNSWGTGWGVDGYFYMRMDNVDPCGMWDQIAFPFFNHKFELPNPLVE